jgi:HAD superfamily hydrolase (TIGR01490 family)
MARTVATRVAQDSAERAGEASARAAEEHAEQAAGAAAEVVADPTAGAFFDVDNTMLRGASIFYLARGLYARKFFTSRDIAHFAWQQAQYRILGHEDMAHMAEARETALSFVEGHHVDELTALGEEVFDEIIAEKIWPGTRALARMHLDAGQRVWLVTATPVEVASVMARRLGLTGALGTVSETVNGIYTGRLVGEPLHGQAKAEAVRALAEREGLDLARCAAYSDSANDIPMLSLVGEPCAVNPDAKLRAYARAHGWKVRDYRTGRKAVKIGVPTAAGVGALAGGTLAALAVRRRRH